MDSAAWTLVVLTLSGISGLAFVHLGRKPAHDPLSNLTHTDDVRCANAMRELHLIPGVGCENGFIHSSGVSE